MSVPTTPGPSLSLDGSSVSFSSCLSDLVSGRLTVLGARFEFRTGTFLVPRQYPLKNENGDLKVHLQQNFGFMRHLL